jgi:hypothetical protein
MKPQNNPDDDPLMLGCIYKAFKISLIVFFIIWAIAMVIHYLIYKTIKIV